VKNSILRRKNLLQTSKLLLPLKLKTSFAVQLKTMITINNIKRFTTNLYNPINFSRKKDSILMARPQTNHSKTFVPEVRLQRVKFKPGYQRL
jgi:hypothetical protein